MTKFSDVAHLYVGCKIQTEDGIFYLTSVGSDDSFTINGDIDYFPLDVNTKPILRPLSSITESEHLEWFGHDKENKDEWYCETYLQDIGAPYKWVILLKNHIDLFELIESGEAIDATTLTPNHYAK